MCNGDDKRDAKMEPPAEETIAEREDGRMHIPDEPLTKTINFPVKIVHSVAPAVYVRELDGTADKTYTAKVY